MIVSVADVDPPEFEAVTVYVVAGCMCLAATGCVAAMRHTPAADATTPRHRSAVEHPHLRRGVVVAGRRGDLGEFAELLSG